MFKSTELKDHPIDIRPSEKLVAITSRMALRPTGAEHEEITRDLFHHALGLEMELKHVRLALDALDRQTKMSHEGSIERIILAGTVQVVRAALLEEAK